MVRPAASPRFHADSCGNRRTAPWTQRVVEKRGWGLGAWPAPAPTPVRTASVLALRRGPSRSSLMAAPLSLPLCPFTCSELFVTEASHLRTLRVLDLIFYQRMKKEGLLPREELARLFPNLPELIEIHSEEPPAHPLPWPDFRFLPTCQDPRAHSPCLYSLVGEPDAQPEASILTPPRVKWLPDLAPTARPSEPSSPVTKGLALQLNPRRFCLLSLPQIPGVKL